MTQASMPIVRHFRQILMWPLQLMPVREGEQVQRHWEYLPQCGRPNPWCEVEDEFTPDPSEFQERHNREFVTFQPHVQRFLYGQGRIRLDQDGVGDSPIRVFRRTDVQRARLRYDDGQQVDFAIKHVDLYFFYDMDVVILVVETHADNLSLDRVQDTLYRFGRAFPAGWEPDQPRQILLVHVVEQRLLLEEGTNRTTLAEEVSTLGVLLANNTTLRLSLSWQTKGRMETLQWTTFLPLRAK